MKTRMKTQQENAASVCVAFQSQEEVKGGEHDKRKEAGGDSHAQSILS